MGSVSFSSQQLSFLTLNLLMLPSLCQATVIIEQSESFFASARFLGDFLHAIAELHYMTEERIKHKRKESPQQHAEGAGLGHC